MRQVTYKQFWMYGALGNPRFFTRAIYNRGKFWYTQYWDTIDGPLYYVNNKG